MPRLIEAPERKDLSMGTSIDLAAGHEIAGYASLFGRRDQGGDVVQKGAYAVSLRRMAAQGRSLRMLWQHDPAQPIGLWDEVREDDRGLWVKGRILAEVARGREALALLSAGAIDGLSIGYRTLRSERDSKGQRLLHEIDLWEVSLVTFPMQNEARIAAKSAATPAETWQGLTRLVELARQGWAVRTPD